MLIIYCQQFFKLCQLWNHELFRNADYRVDYCSSIHNVNLGTVGSLSQINGILVRPHFGLKFAWMWSLYTHLVNPSIYFRRQQRSSRSTTGHKLHPATSKTFDIWKDEEQRCQNTWFLRNGVNKQFLSRTNKLPC